MGFFILNAQQSLGAPIISRLSPVQATIVHPPAGLSACTRNAQGVSRTTSIPRARNAWHTERITAHVTENRCDVRSPRPVALASFLEISLHHDSINIHEREYEKAVYTYIHIHTRSFLQCDQLKKPPRKHRGGFVDHLKMQYYGNGTVPHLLGRATTAVSLSGTTTMTARQA